MRNPVEFTDSSGLRVVIYEAESGSYAFKTFYNNIKVDIALYEFDKEFLDKFKSAIGQFLGQTS